MLGAVTSPCHLVKLVGRRGRMVCEVYVAGGLISDVAAVKKWYGFWAWSRSERGGSTRMPLFVSLGVSVLCFCVMVGNSGSSGMGRHGWNFRSARIMSPLTCQSMLRSPGVILSYRSRSKLAASVILPGSQAVEVAGVAERDGLIPSTGGVLSLTPPVRPDGLSWGVLRGFYAGSRDLEEQARSRQVRGQGLVLLRMVSGCRG